MNGAPVCTEVGVAACCGRSWLRAGSVPLLLVLLLVSLPPASRSGGVGAVRASACRPVPESWERRPGGSEKQQVRWFRRTFIRLAALDAVDEEPTYRVGRMVRAMPTLARLVARRNARLLGMVGAKGPPPRDRAALLAMNLVIREVLGTDGRKKRGRRGGP